MKIKLPGVLGVQNFTYLWISQLLSQVTLNLLLFLILVYVFEKTGSSIATSFVWVAYALPAIIIGPFAAASVDVFDRRKILMVSNLMQALTLLSFAVFFDRSIYLAYWAIFLYSFFNQFYIPAEASVLPGIVKKESYPEANGMFFLTQQMGLIAGFGLGGVLNELIEVRNTIFVSSVFLFLAFVSVSFLPVMRVHVDVSDQVEKNLSLFFRRIMEGYQFIRGHSYILLPFLLLMSLQVSLSVIGTNLPALATEIIKVPANSSSFLVVLPAGAGAGIGTLLVSKLLKRKVRKRRLIEASLAVLAIGVWAVVFIIPAVDDYYRLVAAIVLFVITGVAFAGVLVPAQTFLQEVTPGGMRGRVFGNFWIFGIAATLIPVIFSATITEIFGARLMFFLLGLGAIGGLILAKYHGKGKFQTS